MFTGIVTERGEVLSVSRGERLRHVRIVCAYDPAGIAIGASIACGGPCLTVVAVEPHGDGAIFAVDVANETIERTTAPDWRPGTQLNLERSLKVGDELGGHIVTGHIDGLAEIVERRDITTQNGPWGPSAQFFIRAPRQLARFIAAKGSVCLDGTSLTVNDVEGDRFSVLLIPHTMSVTTWRARRAGDRLNLEIDLMARYAARLAQAQAAGY